MSTISGDRENVFGARLRGLREGRGLTQEQLAEQSGLSANAIGALERGERRRPYPHTIQVLVEALALSLQEREWLAGAIPLPRRTARPMQVHTSLIPLPTPPNPLMGREDEKATLASLLTGAGPRLVTLTGPGGVGKTRLALEVAVEVAGTFPDGVAFVSLVPLVDPSLVIPAIGEALGLRESGGRSLAATLRSFVQDRQLLLVLDNFEHVIAAAPDVADLLAGSPALRVLATSRAPLHVRGEQVYPVEPLRLPDLSRVPSPEAAETSPAVRLFVERAREVSPSFSLDRANAAAVAAICRRLDGLPLAIELAAAWVRVLPPLTLLTRLDQALPILTGGARDLPGRQRTMEHTIGWSYDLLDVRTQALFRRLAVFAGGWTVEAAETVCTGGEVITEDVLGLLAGLVDQSMVASVLGDDGRFRLLEPVRQYAEQLLERHGESDEAYRRHAAWCLLLAEQAEETLGSVGADAWWLDRLETEHDNLRAALAWLLRQKDVTDALRLAAALWPFWHYHSHLSEGRRWLQQALDADNGGSTALRARVLLGTAFLAHYQGDDPKALALVDEGLAIARGLPDIRERIPRRRTYLLALLARGLLAEDNGDYDAAVVALEDAYGRASESGDQTWICVTLLHLGIVAYGKGDVSTAEARLQTSLIGFRALPDLWGAANALDYLGLAAVERREYRHAAAYFVESLTLFREIGSREGLAGSLANVATLLAASGNPEAAARTFGAAETLANVVGSQPKYPEKIAHQRGMDTVRSALEPFVLLAALEDGRTKPVVVLVEEAIALSRELSARPIDPVAPAETALAGLSTREVEVLQLLAAGMTNREIADRLFLSEHTIRAHLRRIYPKLDVTTRTEAVRFAVKHHLG